jgi:hypothetical protein
MRCFRMIRRSRWSRIPLSVSDALPDAVALSTTDVFMSAPEVMLDYRNLPQKKEGVPVQGTPPIV